MSIVWNHHFVNNSKKLMEVVGTNLKSQFLQQWKSEMQESNKGEMYSSMKKNSGKEKYLDLLPSNLLQYLTWFRTANHKLAVETGRWGKINCAQRICNMCSSNEIGDEFHTLCKCPTFLHIRNDNIPSYFVNHPSILKYQILMTKTDNNKILSANIARLKREIFRYQRQMQVTSCKAD